MDLFIVLLVCSLSWSECPSPTVTTDVAAEKIRRRSSFSSASVLFLRHHNIGLNNDQWRGMPLLNTNCTIVVITHMTKQAKQFCVPALRAAHIVGRLLLAPPVAEAPAPEKAPPLPLDGRPRPFD
jgi:hypothetical protein